MIKYKLSNTENGEIVGHFATRQDAADAMDNYISDANNSSTFGARFFCSNRRRVLL